MSNMILEVLYGIFIGLSLGLTGAGGSIITVPILIYLIGLNIHEATGTSLLIVGSGALYGAMGYAVGKEKRVHWRLGTLLALAGIVGAYLGSYVNALIPGYVVLDAFAGLMLIIGIFMFRGHRDRQNQRPPSLKNLRNVRAWVGFLSAGLLIGLLTGFFGVGGGFLIVPILTILLKFPLRDALATSLLVIALNSVWGLLFRLAGVGAIQLDVALFLLVGTILGMTFGIVMARKVNTSMLSKIFAGFVILTAFYMLLRSWFQF